MQELIFVYNNCNGVTEFVTGVTGILQQRGGFDMVFTFNGNHPQIGFYFKKGWNSKDLATRLCFEVDNGKKVVDLTCMTGVKNNG